MKKCLLFSAVAIPMALLAQPTITESQFTLAVGDVITNYSQTYSAPSEGASQNWDYTALSTSSPTTVNIVSPGASGISGLPASTYCYQVGSGYDCYLKDATGVQRTGASSSGIQIPYENGEKVINFPITFNDSQTDLFHAPYNYASYNASRRGTVTNQVVGYGTLHLPNSVTINNAMLVKSHEVYTDSIYIIAVWQVVTYDYTSYNFYAAGYKGTILTMTSGTANGSPASSGSYNIAGSTNGLETYDISNQLTLFPNPAEDVISITNQGNVELNGFEYQVINLNGQVVKSGIFNSNTLEVSDLESGLYMLQVNGDHFKASKKFIKK